MQSLDNFSVGNALLGQCSMEEWIRLFGDIIYVYKENNDATMDPLVKSSIELMLAAMKNCLRQIQETTKRAKSIAESSISSSSVHQVVNENDLDVIQKDISRLIEQYQVNGASQVLDDNFFSGGATTSTNTTTTTTTTNAASSSSSSSGVVVASCQPFHHASSSSSPQPQPVYEEITKEKCHSEKYIAAVNRTPLNDRYFITSKKNSRSPTKQNLGKFYSLLRYRPLDIIVSK